MLVEDGGGVGDAAHLQELPGASGLKDPKRPSLPVTLCGGDVLARELERLFEPVEHGERFAAPLPRQVRSRLVARVDARSQSGLGPLERLRKSALRVREARIG